MKQGGREIAKWNYEASIEKMRPLVLRWQSLTLDIARELYKAREALSHQGARTDLDPNGSKSWIGYLEDTGIPKETARRWLERYDPKADCLLDSKPQIEDSHEPHLVNPQPSKYNIIYADPPWKYQNSSTRAAAENHYPCLSIEELCGLPIADELAADDAVLLMWTTFPLLKESFRVIEAWGFEYKTVAFVWVKTNESGTLFLGIGNYFRSNAEICLFGKRGQGLPPIKRPINTHLHKRMRHSQKPEIFKNLIVETFGDCPRIELFARGTSLGWAGWGFEA